MCNMTYSYVQHNTFICVTCRIHMCNLTNSYVRHDSFILALHCIHKCDTTHSYVTGTTQRSVLREKKHEWVVFVESLICICAMTHSYLCHDSFTGIRTSQAPRYVRHDPFVFLESLNGICAMTYSCAFIRHRHCPKVCVTWDMTDRICGITNRYECHDLFMRIHTSQALPKGLCFLTHDSFMRICTSQAPPKGLRYVRHDWFVFEELLTGICAMSHSCAFVSHRCCPKVCVSWHMTHFSRWVL